MEAKFLACIFSFLSIFLAIYADVREEDSTEYEFGTAVYMGDSNVNLSQPFSVTCIIPVTDPIVWLKDGEPIERHNLRHGGDEHSYILSENLYEGEKHKIEAHISVRHALKVHEGKYQCNNLHTSYHILHVRSPEEASDRNDRSTLPNYKSDIGPRPLPTEQATIHNHQNHRHHHHHQNLSDQRKLSFMNNTKNDESYEYVSGLMHTSGYTPPINNKHQHRSGSTYEFTTAPWGMTPIIRHGPAPVFPTPRTTWLPATMATIPAVISPASQPHPHMPHIVQHQTPIYVHADGSQQQHHQQQQHNLHQQQQQQQLQHHTVTVGNVVTTFDGETYEQPRSPLQTIQTTHQHQYQPTQAGVYFTPITTAPLNPLHSNSQQQRTHQQQQQLYNIGTVPSIPNPLATATSSIAQSATPMLPMSSSTPEVATSPMIQIKSTTPIAKESGSLLVNYDDAGDRLKYFEIRNPLVLSCNDNDTKSEITWERSNTDVKTIKSLEGRYRIISDEKKFIIDRTEATDAGEYSCSNGKSKATINVYARIVVRVPSNMGVVEGEKLSIVCTVVGTSPVLKWAIGNRTIENSTDRFILKADENHIENAILTIENVSLDDRGDYKCIGSNRVNEVIKTVPEASDTSFVRVKGKLAALWPFLGICAEVLILCAIILIYEKRRNKTELEESDTDPQDQRKKRRNYD